MIRSGTAIEITTLEPAHVAPAAALVAARYAHLRERLPVLPEGWAAEATLARIIGELVARGSGAAATRDGALIGFQGATVVDGHGGRWAYTPDVGHATAPLPAVDARRVVESLYTRLADGWVAAACLEHVVTIMADDTNALETLGRIGFGQSVIDLVRDLSPVVGCRPVPGIRVRRAAPADAASISELELGLRSHLSASPVFLRPAAATSPELQRVTLADPGTATFLAEEDGRPVAFLRIGPSATDVATIVRDPGTASITAAFTATGRRGDGIATCLLDAALGWAREAGYQRAAADHESANGEATRFWARHCSPAAISLVRRLPPRAVP